MPLMVPYFDMLGETEPDTTEYTLKVLLPLRPPHRLLPAIFSRPGGSKPAQTYTDFRFQHLDGMEEMTVKIKSAYFPAEMRCKHVLKVHKCERGCYVLEKGGDHSQYRCRRKDCEGHVYNDWVREYEGVKCFGPKGKRMASVIGVS